MILYGKQRVLEFLLKGKPTKVEGGVLKDAMAVYVERMQSGMYSRHSKDAWRPVMPRAANQLCNIKEGQAVRTPPEPEPEPKTDFNPDTESEPVPQHKPSKEDQKRKEVWKKLQLEDVLLMLPPNGCEKWVSSL